MVKDPPAASEPAPRALEPGAPWWRPPGQHRSPSRQWREQQRGSGALPLQRLLLISQIHLISTPPLLRHTASDPAPPPSQLLLQLRKKSWRRASCFPSSVLRGILLPEVYRTHTHTHAHARVLINHVAWLCARVRA